MQDGDGDFIYCVRLRCVHNAAWLCSMLSVRVHVYSVCSCLYALFTARWIWSVSHKMLFTPHFMVYVRILRELSENLFFFSFEVSTTNGTSQRDERKIILNTQTPSSLEAGCNTIYIVYLHASGAKQINTELSSDGCSSRIFLHSKDTTQPGEMQDMV